MICNQPLLRLIHTYYAVPMPFPCRVNSHMPCCDPALLRQCRVFRERPRGKWKYPNCIWVWFTSGNNLRGTPRGSRKMSNEGRLIHTYHAVPTPLYAALCRGLERSLSERHGLAWQGNGMACVNQTRPHFVNQMGKRQSKPLAERHGRETAWYVWISLLRH
jgi:hypothetical protein